jgi:hypothetical protein
MTARIARAAGCFGVCGGDTDDVAVAKSDETGEAGKEEAGEEGSTKILC